MLVNHNMESLRKSPIALNSVFLIASLCSLGSVLKNPPANTGDLDLIPELGRFPGGGNHN